MPRAWPLAWPSPSGPLGRQRSPALKGGSRRSFLRSGQKRSSGALDAGGADPDNARQRPGACDFSPGDWRTRCETTSPASSRSAGPTGALRRVRAAAGCGASARRAAARDGALSRWRKRARLSRHLRRKSQSPSGRYGTPPRSFTLSVLVLRIPSRVSARAGRPGAPKACP